MASFKGITADGQEVVYTDKKRHIWWFGWLGSIVVLGTIPLYFALEGNPLVTFIPMFYIYIFTAIVDKIMGVDEHNPPEEVVNEMAADNFYRWQVHSRIPVAIMILFAYIWFVGTQDLPWWSMIALIIGIGTSSGGVMMLTHELGHKSNKWDRLHAKIGNMIMGYGHFNIEHNRGHHVMVSTPEDPASSRMGENIYRFAIRELTGTFKRGLYHEKRRLNAAGHSFWSWRNDVLQVYAVTLTIMIGSVFLFGPQILWFLILHNVLGWYTLTQANYVEHYGLLREKLPNGKYERTQPRHSWNTNHTFSNTLLFHLQRHSDHHAYPLRPYQVLRDFPNLPSLPSGYGGCFAMAAFPPLWFKVMNPKVMEWAGGDITKVNIDPKKKDRLYAKWGGGDMGGLTPAE